MTGTTLRMFIHGLLQVAEQEFDAASNGMTFLTKSCAHVFSNANDSQLDYVSERQIPLLKSPSAKKTGVLWRTTASECRGPKNSKTGPASGMTASENSTEISGSR